MHNNAILNVRSLLTGLPTKSSTLAGLFWPMGHKGLRRHLEKCERLGLTRRIHRTIYVTHSQGNKEPEARTSFADITWDLHCSETAWTHPRSLANIDRRVGKLWRRPFILRVSPLCNGGRIAEQTSDGRKLGGGAAEQHTPMHLH